MGHMNTPMASKTLMADTWHITIPLLLHSTHVDAGSLIRVCRNWDLIVRDAYHGLGTFHRLAYVCSVSRRLVAMRFVALMDHVIRLPTADAIAAVLVAASSECFWGLLGSLGEDGCLWQYLNAEWRMSASKHHTHALAISGVINQPRWLSFFRAQMTAGVITEAQFGVVRTAFYSRVLGTLDAVTEFHCSIADG